MYELNGILETQRIYLRKRMQTDKGNQFMSASRGTLKFDAMYMNTLKETKRNGIVKNIEQK